MKRLGRKWFEKPKRKPRIAKKRMDQTNRSRENMFYLMSIGFTVLIKSKEHERAIKGKLRSLRITPKAYRKFCNGMCLTHRRLSYKATCIGVQTGFTRRLHHINRKDLDWWRTNHLVVTAVHADGTRETFFE